MLRQADDLTIGRPPARAPLRLDLLEDLEREPRPSLWKDLTAAAVLAVLLWGLAAYVLLQ